ncbi:PEP-CTERM sorting domain-containing protein [Verrucomicrobiaceae bacterium N1E253]|uniref:PEP-CTERM sorting domain-containing protein n=1 Tax=Oceaniferula marina TaxID=2748318 RepID=A0A851GGM8_9BACT|nr:PEP-CTERM sorting domain-containing protein [Oceaniferula marina]NWK56359.1 PEP-CTERM sorting domain-containing protein [Oceaniferula marina]
MNVKLTLMAIATTSLTAHAATIVTSEGPANNQAGPNFGQSITVNIGADTPDGSIPGTVYLQELSFRQTNSTTGINTTDTAWIHVYDAFTVDGTSSPTAIGNLITVSSTTVNFTTTGAGDLLTWSFTGDAADAILKGTEYYYVLATDQNAATVGNSSNLTTQGFRLTTGDPYSGGQTLRANGSNADWDNEFVLTTITDPVPEPSSSALLGLGAFALIFRRRK